MSISTHHHTYELHGDDAAEQTKWYRIETKVLLLNQSIFCYVCVTLTVQSSCDKEIARAFVVLQPDCATANVRQYNFPFAGKEIPLPD